MGTFYDILDIKWNFTTNDIEKVVYSTWTKKHSVSVPSQSSTMIEFSSDVWKLFKRDFPEHCVHVEESRNPSSDLDEFLGNLI